MTTAISSAEPPQENAPPRTEDARPLRAVYTPNFPALLRQLGASLLVTTYQAGKLVLVRDEGDHLNNHFRGSLSPMGMALEGDRLAVGTRTQVWEFVDVPAVTVRLKSPGRHDACFLPRSSHVTGNIEPTAERVAEAHRPQPHPPPAWSRSPIAGRLTMPSWGGTIRPGDSGIRYGQHTDYETDRGLIHPGTLKAVARSL